MNNNLDWLTAPIPQEEAQKFFLGLLLLVCVGIVIGMIAYSINKWKIQQEEEMLERERAYRLGKELHERGMIKLSESITKSSVKDGYCSYCGRGIEDGKKECKRCGAPVRNVV